MKNNKAMVARTLKKFSLLMILLGSFYGLLNLSWLGPWTTEPLYWKPHLTYGDAPNEIYITCRTPDSCKLQVNYQIKENSSWGSSKTLIETAATEDHNFLFNNLTPGFDIKYFIEPTSDNTGIISQSILKDLKQSFVIPGHTIHSNTIMRPFQFGIYGDNRPTVFGTENHEYMVHTIREQNPDFVLQVGDLVQQGGDEFEWARFFDNGEELFRSIPLLPTPGNHEYYSEVGEANATNYLEAYKLPGNESYYAYNISNAHFISLDVSSNHGAKNFGIQALQAQWLDHHLSNIDRSDFDWLFVFFHYPIYATGETHPDIWNKFLNPIFSKYNLTIDILFVGHIHQYERLWLSELNTWCIVAGGGGAEVEQVNMENYYPGSEVLELSHSFSMVKIDGLNLDYKGILLKGEVFDTMQINKTKGGI
jgi:calcineurin-like phosphoesterase family protein